MGKKRKRSLGKAEEVAEERAKKGLGKSIFNKDFPDVEKIELKEGRNKLDIVPYEISGDGHPEVAKGKMEPGDLDFVFDVNVHRFIGADKEHFVCLRDYGKECPLCDAAWEARDEGDEDTFKDLKASRRVWYNVVDKDGNVKIINEASYYTFGKTLQKFWVEEKEDTDSPHYADPEEGLTVKVTMEEAKIGSNKFLEATFVKFLDRDPFDEAIIEEVVQFDKYIDLLDPAYLKKVLEGIDATGIEDDDEEEEEEERTPLKRKRRKKKEPEPEEELDDDDDEEEPECPFEHQFGKDFEKSDDCEECELWSECNEEFERLRRARRRNRRK